MSVSIDCLLYRRGYEMLLRKLLGYRQHPAIIALHSWSPFFNHPNFFSTAEDPIQSIVAYYGLQSVSMRNALFHATWQRQQNFKGSQWLCDNIHPNTLGHRSTPSIIHIQNCMLHITIPQIFHSLSCAQFDRLAIASGGSYYGCQTPYMFFSLTSLTSHIGPGKWAEKKLAGIAVYACLCASFLPSIHPCIKSSIQISKTPCTHKQKCLPQSS